MYIRYLHARGTKVVYTGGYFAGAATNPSGLATWVAAIVANINNYNYDGIVSQLLAKGTYTTAQLSAKGVSNNRASSVKIPCGWTVIIYDSNNFTGTSWTLTANNSSLAGLSPSANDKMTSVKIQ